MKICILGYDGLEIELVEKFDCKNLKQVEYGKTDISEFDRVQTGILWPSAITGENLEEELVGEEGNNFLKEVLRGPYYFFKQYIPTTVINTRIFFEKLGLLDKVTGNLKTGDVAVDRTFFNGRDKIGINIPTYDQEDSAKYGFDDYFRGDVSEDNFVSDAWNLFDRTKNRLLNNLDKRAVMAWFSIADKIGHIFRPDMDIMRKTYEKLDRFAGRIEDEFDGLTLIVSDHGMKELGKFGDHSDLNYGFWSSSKKLGLKNPRFVDLRYIVEDLLNDNFDENRFNQGKIKDRKEKAREFDDDTKEIKKRLEELGYF